MGHRPQGRSVRSLAGELRRAGGFAKDITPFTEFLWADSFRRKLSRKNVDDNFARAMEKGHGALPGAGTQSICPAGADPPWTTRASVLIESEPKL